MTTPAHSQEPEGQEEPTAAQVMEFRAVTGVTPLKARQYLEDNPPALIKRIIDAHREVGRIPQLSALASGSDAFRDKLFEANLCAHHAGRLNDPAEQDSVKGPIINRVLEDVGIKVRKEHGGEHRMGACHIIWREAKKRLKRDHGIEWHSPAELNPETCFD